MKILFILPNFNIYGGTPKKTLDFIKNNTNDCYLYVYEKKFVEFKILFKKAGANIIEGFYERNLFKHLKTLLKIIKKNEIQLIQTQFFMGELLGALVKIYRPDLKLVIAFVGPFKPIWIKYQISKYLYKKADAFIFVSHFVQEKKLNQFPRLKNKKSRVIFNGSSVQIIDNKNSTKLKKHSLVTTSALVEWKNIDLLVDVINVLKTKYGQNIYLYIAGDGPERNNISKKISQFGLNNYIFLLGYQTNIGNLLHQADIYLHPAYEEGFGIAVLEAMLLKKPIIVSNAGALPELIKNEESGLVVEPFDVNAWVSAILKLLENTKYRNELGCGAHKMAVDNFSLKNFTNNYHNFYNSLLQFDEISNSK